MDLKSHPVFGYILISLGLVAVGESYWIYNRYSADKKAHTVLATAQSQELALKASDPFPNAENAQMIADDLKTAQGNLDALKAQLKGNGAKADALATAKPPASADEFVIELTAFRNAELAKLAELKPVDTHNKVKDTEAFGFTNFAKKGPTTDLMEPIYRDKLIAEYLLDTLLACEHKPDSFISLKRETAYSAKEKKDYQQAYVNYQALGPAKPGTSATPPKLGDNPKDAGPDIFKMNLLESARVPNLVDATAFQISFESQTITLREFLLALGKFDLPVVVSAVEWDAGAPGIPEEDAAAPAAAPTDAASAVSPGASKAAAPLVVKAKPKVVQQYTKWKVTVEYIQLVTPVEADVAPVAAPKPPKTSS
jgi:hypothetical protein